MSFPYITHQDQPMVYLASNDHETCSVPTRHIHCRPMSFLISYILDFLHYCTNNTLVLGFMFDMYHQGIIYLVTTFTYNPYRIQCEILSFTHTVVPMINQDKEKRKKKYSAATKMLGMKMCFSAVLSKTNSQIDNKYGHFKIQAKG